MKTTLKPMVLLLAVAAVLTSCMKDPVSQFSYEPLENPEAGEDIQFINESVDAKDYYWDFGNDQNSVEENPTATFHVPGNYTVTLVSESMFRADSVSETILINPPTVLEVTVFMPEGQPLVSATARLYKSYSDAGSFSNAIKHGTTDSFGTVSFHNLEAQSYYITIIKGMDGSGGSYRTGGAVTSLNLNEINSFYGVADYYDYSSSKLGMDDIFSKEKIEF